MTFEERLYLREAIAAIQRAKELRARRMWIKVKGEKIRMGGGSRPPSEQIKSGYPSYYDNPGGTGWTWEQQGRKR